MNTITLDTSRVAMLRAMLKPILTPELWPVVELMLEPVTVLVTTANDGWVNGHPDAAHTAKLVHPKTPVKTHRSQGRKWAWTPADDDALIARYNMKEGVASISAAIGRSMAGVYMRILLLREAGKITAYHRPDLAKAAKQRVTDTRARHAATNHAAPYTASEDEFIVERYTKGMSYNDIATALQRLPKAIMARVHVLRKEGKITTYRDERSANQAELSKKWYADKASSVTT